MISAVIVAAGSSRRMGFDKLGVEVLGRPLLIHTVAAFEASPLVEQVIVVTAPERFPMLEAWRESLGWTKLAPLIAGGKERHDSVMAGLNVTNAGLPLIAVQDGARPLTTPALIARCADEARVHGAACAAAPIAETLKRRDPETGYTTEAVDRQELWGMQTPQIFRRQILLDAYGALEGRLVTDEASAVEMSGMPVKIVENPEWNVKVTYPRDLPLVEWILADRLASANA